MNNWNDGYVVDIAYTYGYYPGMNPARLPLAFAFHGLRAPAIQTACELGFGQGLSTNFHAAASGTRWWGNDFNPLQAAFARELAAASGSGAQLEDSSFSHFCRRDDLPDFDFIALHGIWSWVSQENREIIFDFIDRKLKPGGVLYLSYNTQPGWSAFMPLRDLLVQHTQQVGNDEQGLPTAARIDAALAFAAQMFETDPVYAQANPFMRDRLKILQQQPRSYLAHEYFNRDWHAEAFADIHRCLARAGLQFACPAHYIDHLDMANLTPAQRQCLAGISDPVLYQSVRDFMVNQTFRRDYWVRGGEVLDERQRVQALALQSVVLLTEPDKVPLTIQNVASEITLNRLIYEPILQALSDYQPHTLVDLAATLAHRNLNLSQVIDSALMLIGTGHAAPLPAESDAATQAQIARRTGDLNAWLLQRAALAPTHGLGSDEGDISHLVSPLTGGGVRVDRVEQLFLLARQHCGDDIDAWPAQVWRHVSAQGKRLVRDGVRLEGEEENLAELATQARLFARTRLPLLQALQVA
ncbi:SAM-dependent methyltransferase [Herbaspirillum sp. BH-1]|uniref:SAM-dependent methyltransferase n=1 Tax=Herbaspirillum frisingense TaxID=92645 RepID=A0ABU1PHM3_9BURK|nr:MULTISPECIES: methyltransferase regulatory domain-containing protein [Herbaspirillum]MDR6584848.1 SAM-dependent methyltransferase [Herbaspirillum frisingense]PLY60705.1 SAM-dependent methyltransferase [Herbaspirillum sp. BH-1]